MKRTRLDHGSRAGRKCCVEGCPNRFNSMYRFPRSDPELFTVWLERIKPPYYTTLSYEKIYRKYAVCEDHFPLECKVAGAKRGLTNNAVPSLNIPEPSNELQKNWSLSDFNESLKSEKVQCLNKPDQNLDQDMCRACLKKSNKMYPLKGPIINCYLDLYIMINYCISDEIDLSEDLPQNVCFSCFETIKMSYNFIHKYKSNQETLLAARQASVKLETQDTDFYDAVHLITANQETKQQCDQDSQEEENLEFSSFEKEENSQTRSKPSNYIQEELQIKFEHGDDQNYVNDEKVEEITIEGTTDETVLLNLMKQDNIEVEGEEEVDVNELFQLSYDDNNKRNVKVNTVNIAKSKDYLQSNSFNISDNSSVSIVQSEVGSNVQHVFASNSTVQSDHNYFSTLQNGDKNNESNDNGSSAVVSVAHKFIPIQPKVSKMQNILITPVIPTNSAMISSKSLEVRLLPLKSKFAFGSEQKLLHTTGIKTVVLKKRFGSTRTSLNPVKKKIIIKKLTNLDDRRQGNDESSERIHELSHQIPYKTSRRIVISYPCPKCPNLVFLGHESKFKSHILSHDKENMDCNKCSAKDLEPNVFLEHFLSCHRFECPQCQKSFKNKHNLVTHLRKHLNIRHFCTYPNCTKSFAMPFALKKHLEEHTGQVKYPCKICGHISTTYDTHNYHVRMHGGRKFLCNQCGQTFLQASHLKAHMWKHTGKKCFKCDQCTNSYTSLGPLRKHKRKYHP